MSLDAMVWAVKDAPTANTEEHAVLTVMADEADEAGCGVYLATSTIAERARMSERAVRRCLDDLEDRGLVGRGDQRLTAHLRADRRPVVYDLLIPYQWFGNVARVNKARVARGRPPLTAEERPDLGPPPPKKRRADAGKPKQRGARDQTAGPPDGVTASPLVDGVTGGTGGLVARHGGTSSSPRGDYQSADPVINPVIDPRAGSLTSFGNRAPGDFDAGPTVQPALDGSVPDPPPEQPSPAHRAFGIARGWLDLRMARGTPPVMRRGADPLHALRALIEPTLAAGYTDVEVKRALVLVDVSLPSAAQLERALVEVRAGPRSARGRPPGGRTAGENRHVDQLTPKERRARNPFLTAVRSSDVLGASP